MVLVLFGLIVGCSEYTVNDAVTTPAGTNSESSTSFTTVTSTMVTETTATTATTVVTVPTTPVATGLVYANTSDTLYEVDPATGAYTEVGQFYDPYNGEAVEYFVDIAIDLDGYMYGGTFDSLYQIDPTNANVRQVCEVSVDMYALTFTSTGVLFAGGGQSITEVDTATCATSALVSGGVYKTSGDLVGLPDGYLYWTIAPLSDSGDGSDGLVRVDPNDGSTQYQGDTGYENIFGLGYHDDELYGFNSVGQTIRIDPYDATAELISTSAFGWWGATTNPVQW